MEDSDDEHDLHDADIDEAVTEQLPFAIMEQSLPLQHRQQQQHQQHVKLIEPCTTRTSSSLQQAPPPPSFVSSNSGYNCFHPQLSYSASSLPPALASSVISSPTDGEDSQASSFLDERQQQQQHQHSTTLLDAAASLLYPTTSTTTSSFHLMGSYLPQFNLSQGGDASVLSTSAASPPHQQQQQVRQLQQQLQHSAIPIDQSLRFSELLQEADDSRECRRSPASAAPPLSTARKGTTTMTTTTTTTRPQSLPVLPEESVAGSSYASGLSPSFATLSHASLTQQQQQQYVQTQQYPSTNCNTNKSSSRPGCSDWSFFTPFFGATTTTAASDPVSSSSSSSSKIVFHNPSETIIPAGPSESSSLPYSFFSTTSPDASIHRSNERRMASLAGATATRTSDSSFTVAVEISVASSSSDSVQDVMDILGNPDLLKMWCDPIEDLVITRSSEGARTERNRLQHRHHHNHHHHAGVTETAVSPLTSTAASSSSSSSSLAPPHESQFVPRREYEGEWIEATTAQLMAPTNTSCFYSAGRSMSAALGFPCYGKITMFVERQRGQVGLTIGPFPGQIEVSHKLKIQAPTTDATSQHQQHLSRIRIVDEVRIQKDTDDDESVSFCGIFDALEKLLLPTVEDYMDQVLSSMARLRFLVENGERSVYMEASSGSGGGGGGGARRRGAVEDETLSTPLLSGFA